MAQPGGGLGLAQKPATQNVAEQRAEKCGILTATLRPTRGSTAKKTTPSPPRPTSRSIRKGPTRCQLRNVARSLCSVSNPSSTAGGPRWRRIAGAARGAAAREQLLASSHWATEFKSPSRHGFVDGVGRRSRRQRLVICVHQAREFFACLATTHGPSIASSSSCNRRRPRDQCFRAASVEMFTPADFGERGSLPSVTYDHAALRFRPAARSPCAGGLPRRAWPQSRPGVTSERPIPPSARGRCPRPAALPAARRASAWHSDECDSTTDVSESR